MKRQIRKERGFGLLFLAIYFILNRFFQVHPFLMGGLLSLDTTLLIMGFLPEKLYSALKQKKNLS